MRKTWHIWIVGIAALAWNAIAAMDYVMVQTNNSEYLAQFTSEQMSFFNNFPAWANAAWAIAVWFGVAGSLLILFRKRWAAHVFGISLLAMMLTAFQNLYLSKPAMQDVVGIEAIYFTVLVFVIALLLWIYARVMTSRGLLN